MVLVQLLDSLRQECKRSETQAPFSKKEKLLHSPNYTYLASREDKWGFYKQDAEEKGVSALYVVEASKC